MTESAQVNAADIGDFYDRITDVYIAVWGPNIHVGCWDDDESSVEVATERLNDLLIERLAPVPGQRVLDVGCGIGRPAISLARACEVEVVGVSISRHQVRRATAQAAEAGLKDRMRFEHADAAALPFADGSFDAAWAVESLIHMSDKAKVLSEVARVLRPGGRFAIADMFHQQTPFDTHQDVVTTIGFEDYRPLLEGAGITPLDITDVTEQVRLPERIKTSLKAKLLERREELAPIVGEEVYRQLSDPESDLFDHPGFGYLLATGRRD